MSLLLCTILAGWSIGPAQTLSARARPIHVGIVHPAPNFCLGQERSQRDLRLLRLAFRIKVHQPGAAALPWFYKRHRRGGGGRDNGDRRPLLALDTDALWGKPLYALLAREPEFPGDTPLPSGRDLLRDWRKRVIDRVPALAEAPVLSLAQFVEPSGQTAPFWHSRLGGSALLPHYPATSAVAQPACIRWPKDITYRAAQGDAGYTLQRRAEAGAFRISAYLTLKFMLRRLQWGKLDAVLLDGGELVTALEARLALPRPVVGRSPGTQQIVLLPRPGLPVELGPGAMHILSLATPRSRLAAAAGPGFIPASAFFPPAPGSSGQESGSLLKWDARAARRGWLKFDNPPRRLSLTVLDHPLLQRVAQNLASQWKKTLGLELEIQALAVEKFYLSEVARRADFTLLVADLDNGTLQDLWRAALPSQSAQPIVGPIAGPEALLQKTLPFLPLIDYVHYLLAPSPKAYRRAAHLCPGCGAARPEPLRRPGRP